MFKTILAASVMTLALAGVAQAGGADAQGQFYATPVQKGAPTDLPGERLVPGASQAAMVIDGVVGPVVPVTQQVGAGVGQVVGGVVEPVGAVVGGPAVAAAGPGPMKMKRHRHAHHHHMMKRKMKKM